MRSNTITEIIDTLSVLEIQDEKLAWQLRQFMDRLWLLEGLYDDLSCGGGGLNSQERDRYVNEVFPSILVQCRKLSRYFTVCPELRKNDQDIEMLKTHFRSYSKIADRFLNKLQRAQYPSRFPFVGKIKKWLAALSNSVRDICASFSRSVGRVTCFFRIPYFGMFFRQKTLVVYRMDSVDNISDGNLQPIAGLMLEYC